MGSENNFNGIYFHHHFYLKTGVSKNGLSPGYSERDTSSVVQLISINSFSYTLWFTEYVKGSFSTLAKNSYLEMRNIFAI